MGGGGGGGGGGISPSEVGDVVVVFPRNTYNHFFFYFFKVTKAFFHKSQTVLHTIPLIFSIHCIVKNLIKFWSVQKS